MVKGIKQTAYNVPVSKSSKTTLSAPVRKNVAATKAGKPYPSLSTKVK